MRWNGTAFDLNITQLSLRCDPSVSQRDIDMVRGFVATRAKDDRFHNHRSYGITEQRYPLIQYKTVNDTVHVFAIGDVGRELNRFMDIEEIPLIREGKDKRVVKVLDRKIDNFVRQIGIGQSLHSYQFAIPWWAMNQENYHRWQNRLTTWAQRNEFLRVLLSSHIGTAMKYLAPKIFQGLYDWNKKITIRLLPDFSQKFRAVPFKDFKVLGFTGQFQTNVILPEGIGIGNRPSFGFGTVVNAPVFW